MHIHCDVYLHAGHDASYPGKYPWQCSLRFSNYRGGTTHSCRCSIIGTRWIATAAHCTVDMERNYGVASSLSVEAVLKELPLWLDFILGTEDMSNAFRQVPIRPDMKHLAIIAYSSATAVAAPSH